MTITLTEMFLLGWALVITVLWVLARAQLRVSINNSFKIFEAIADKKIQVIRKTDGDITIREH
jgi:uncharacterized protein YggT (Ycf19 family)